MKSSVLHRVPESDSQYKVMMLKPKWQMAHNSLCCTIEPPLSKVNQSSEDGDKVPPALAPKECTIWDTDSVNCGNIFEWFCPWVQPIVSMHICSKCEQGAKRTFHQTAAFVFQGVLLGPLLITDCSSYPKRKTSAKSWGLTGVSLFPDDMTAKRIDWSSDQRAYLEVGTALASKQNQTNTVMAICGWICRRLGHASHAAWSGNRGDSENAR
jgi:hypothetical protein